MTSFKGELLATDDGSLTVRHPLYDEAFHASQGARFETKALYIDGSGFEATLAKAASASSFGVLDVGLGLGYNALMTIESWWKSPGIASVHMLSLEISAELLHSLRDPDCPWKKDWSPEWRNWAEALSPLDPSGQAQLRIQHPRGEANFFWRVQIGEATAAVLPAESFDFIWQDAFSPQKNPELWSLGWLRALRQSAKPQALLMTYSVARLVKDHVSEAGWSYEKFKMPGYKKEWLRARLKTT